jgi:hypothetical protein
MRKHHTKTKGDIGVAHAIADLMEKGWGVLLPLTEHEAFDLVAYRAGRFLRVQVKYRVAKRGGIKVRFTSSWADRHGNHWVPIDKNAIDVMCTYCPDTGRCYYVDPRQYRHDVTLRIVPTQNNQRDGIHFVENFTEIPATVGVPAQHLSRLPAYGTVVTGTRP